MKKTILFDLDGTLLYTLEDLYLSANEALGRCGFPPRSIQEIRQFVGNGVRNLMRRCVPGAEENPRFEECYLAFQEHYALHLNDHTRPYEGIAELLEQLSGKGYRMAIVSNKPDAAVKELNRHFFGDRIPVAIGESKGIRRKPAPDTVRKAARELGISLADCVYVGDSEVDLETARNAGVSCVSVSWGFRERDFLLSQGAEILIDRPEKLMEVLENETDEK